MRTAIAFLLPLVTAVAASAVLIDGADGSRHAAPFAVPTFLTIGVRGCCSAVYLGNGVVLTANHVGAGSVSFDGVVYPYVPGSALQVANGDGSYADLLLFEVYPQPNLLAPPIAAVAPPFGASLLVVGNGLDRGAPLVWNPSGGNPPGPIGGYSWGSVSHMRWGTNHLEVYPAGGFWFNTHAFGSFFDAGTGAAETQAVPGDSGGGVFWISPDGQSPLVGVMIGIVQYSGQPPSSSLYGQRTFYADLAYYRPQLVDAVTLPEPDRALAPGAVGLALLAVARRRSRGVDV